MLISARDSARAEGWLLRAHLWWVDRDRNIDVVREGERTLVNGEEDEHRHHSILIADESQEKVKRWTIEVACLAEMSGGGKG